MTKPCILKLSHWYSCMRHNRQIMGSEAQVKSAEQRLKPFLTEKGMPMDMPDGWKTKYGENFLVEKNRRTSGGTGLKLEHKETCVPSNDGMSDVE